ncbi:MAG: M28 family metallopeptidase [Pseudomonadota bacterium]
MKYFALSAIAASLLMACSPANESSQQSNAEPAEQQADSQSQKPDLEGSAFNPNFRDYLKTISADEFEGREPSTEGEEKVVSFIENHFEEWGLKPYNEETGSYRQSVPLVKIMPYKVSDLSFSGDQAPETMDYRTDMMAWSMQVTEEVDLSQSEMVFVGYGIVAPEYDWNDYEGIDVEGKTVVMFVNDPGYATQDPELFNGNAMTYYGRWTYKYEEAARQGAAGVLIIHETDAAGYGWGVVAGGSPVRYDLKKENNNMDRAQVEGWLTKDSAEQLLSTVDLSVEEAHQLALSDDFEAMSLNTEANLSVSNKFEELSAYNVVGYIEGSKHPEEHVIYMAHHDHLGTDPVREDDPIYNGAQDNGTGTAGLLALAEKFAQQPQPERSVMFLAVGAEESGLLGSKWYAEEPLMPLSKTVGGINMDVMNVYGPVKDMVVIGYGNSEMDQYLKPYIEKQNRYLAPNPTPEAGFFYRSDHFSLAKKGVPMLYAKGGNEHLSRGKEWVEEQRAKYVAEAYHKPADEYNEDWDLRGVQQDLSAFFELGYDLANSRDWPQWTPGNEFEAARKATEDQRKD